MSLETWYSASELSGLPGLPATQQNVKARAKRECWQSRPRQGRGGGQEYHFSSLPEATQAHLINAATPDNLPVPAEPEQPLATVDTAPKDVTQLKRHQRETMIARLALLNELDRLTAVLGRGHAVNVLCGMAAAGTLRDDLQARVPQALAKRKRAGKLSRSTVFRWLKQRGKGEAALAPQGPSLHAAPPWWPLFLKLYRRPQKVSIAWVHEQMAKALPPEDCPSLDQVYYAHNKMGAIERLRGRVGARELANHRPFRRRDASMYWPTDIYAMDGHTFDAEVAHFETGSPFRPEITTCIDWPTRRIVGWSVALAESAWAVLDALRHACCTGGIPGTFYVDNGSGYKNAVMTAEAVGMIDRLGIQMAHSRPYNSKAHGIIERPNATLWVRAAKELPTYMGKDMDPEAKKKVYQRTRKDLATAGVSPLLMSWRQFVEFAEQQVHDYNHRPHSGLPKITDPETGKRRHQTPMEAWDEGIAEGLEAGVEFAPVDPALDADLFRPYVFRKAVRGEVVIGKNRYYSKALEEYHGQTLRIGYDIHDAGHVWVRDINDVLICVAEFEANKAAAFPVSQIEEGRAKRAKGRAARLARQLDEVEAELHGGRPPIEAAPLDPEQVAEIDAFLDRHALEHEGRDDEFSLVTRIDEPRPIERPVVRDEYDFYGWASAQPRDRLGEADQRRLAALEQDPAFMTTWREVYGEGSQ